jgi:ADP-dependent NAD(P)H-hydrate dehydratase / NAD(P)H-hydrate epimerase
MLKVNSPDLWRNALPRPRRDGHKYDRGHTLILGSETYTGATRLAAEACSRVGSGLVTVISAAQAVVYRATLPADIMIREQGLPDGKPGQVLLAGPGGCSDAQADLVLRADCPAVLDADAIRLARQMSGRSRIVTPHDGEFSRYYPDLHGDRIDQTLAAAKDSDAILVRKGAETLIAAPDGRLVRNETASPYLAKAGTGDVLAGLIAGLVAQGMPPFDAACAGVWLHGRAGQDIGRSRRFRTSCANYSDKRAFTRP